MNEILTLINEMSPYLLLGFFIAGLMHAFVPARYYTRYLAAPSFRSVLNAALLGVPLPLCSCGVIPTAMSLRREGASKGAVASFLIATPQTGVDSIIATYSLMGLPFAIIRPLVAFVTALFGGTLVNGVDRIPSRPTPDPSLVGRGVDTLANDGETIYSPPSTGGAGGGSLGGGSAGGGSALLSALRYAFVDMVEDIGRWLVVGIVVAALITVLVPDSFFAVFADNTWLSMFLVLAISIPMYVCATGSIPIAVALMMKGLTPGAALVLLMAGPAANMASILVIRQRLGTRTLAAYLTAIIVGAVGFGTIIDYCLPRTWFTASLIQSGCCQAPSSWFQWSCTGLLLLLLANAFLKRNRRHAHC